MHRQALPHLILCGIALTAHGLRPAPFAGGEVSPAQDIPVAPPGARAGAVALPHEAALAQKVSFRVQAHTELPSVAPLRLAREEDCSSCRGLLADYHAWLFESPDPTLSVATVALIGAVLIWLLLDTTQHFFTPPLLYWSQRLQLRPEVAGATLLAMGNGAPDLSDTIAAANSDDLPLALSELLGSNMFCLSVTGASCLLATAYFKKARRPRKPVAPTNERLLESLAWYAIGFLTIIWILSDGIVHLWEAMTLPFIYCAYLARLVGAPRAAASVEAAAESKSSVVEEPIADESLPGLGLPLSEPMGSVAAAILLWPLYAVRWVTIPPSDKRWDRTRRLISAMCPLGLVTFCFATGWLPARLLGPGPENAVAVGAIAAMLGAGLYFSSDDGPELPWFYGSLTLVAKVSSILWLGTIANEITAILESLGRYYEISQLRIGLSVIAWGNTVGDCFTCIALASIGQTSIALTGVVAGPLFNDLVGLGAGLVWAAVQRGGQVAVFHSPPIHDRAAGAMLPTGVGVALIACAVCVACCVAVLIAMALTDVKVSWPFHWAALLYGSYAVFLVLAWCTTVDM